MKQVFASLAVALVLLTGAEYASAQGATVTDAEVIQPDGVSFRTTINGSSNSSWVFYTNALRSYAIEIWPIENSLKNDFNVNFVVLNAAGVVPAGWTVTDRTAAEPKFDFAGNQTNGKRHVLAASTFDGANGLAEIRLTNGGAGFKAYQIRVVDTTLFSPAWSTNSSYETYYSFYNTTNQTIAGTLVLTRADGTVAATQALSLPAGRTTPTNTVSLGIVTDSTGTATFYHDGPAGSVLAESIIANFASTPAYVQYVNFKAREYFR